MRVLLMGNGSSILDYEYGDIIDSKFDLIFRINRFRTIGFEKYVGKNTDAWITVDYVADWIVNQTQLDNCEASNLNVLDEIQSVYFFIPEFKYSYEYDRISKLGLDREKYQILPVSIEQNINSVVDFKPQWPSTGSVSLQLLVSNYDDIYIHGFDFYDEKYKYYHYVDVGDENRLTANRVGKKSDHDMDKDKELIKYLMEKYNVKVLSENIGEFDE